MFVRLLFFRTFLIFFGVFLSLQLTGQTNVNVATATLVNSFPYTESNVNTNGGGTATGMNGSCSAIPCCSTLVYRLEVPAYGCVRGQIHNFVPLAGSMIAYYADIDNPMDYSDLTYFATPGNFCGFRDTLQLGRFYDWNNGNWYGTPDMNNPDHVCPPGVYYVLFFGYNNQAGLGANTDISFDFAAFCPDGYSCSFNNVTICDDNGYMSATGNLYTSSGFYTDTLPGAANGGLDSLIYTNLSVKNYSKTDNHITDELLCQPDDTLRHPAYTEKVSFVDLDKSDDNWIEANNVIPSIVGTNRSVFTWIKKSTTVSSSSQMIAAINTSSGGNVCNLQIGTNEKLGIYDGSNSHYTNVTITDGSWHFVGYTYDEATDTTKMWVDGIMAGKYKNSQTVGATNQFSIGQEFDSGNSKGNYLDGILTHFTVWNEVLDSSEIALLINGSLEASHPKYANLVAYYPMIIECDNDISAIKDFSTNGFDAWASHANMQSEDSLLAIPNFNSVSQFSIEWLADGSRISVADTLELTSFSSGSYQLKLDRDMITLTDDWTVTVGCPGSDTDIVITEISYNPPESGSDSTEYVELYNSGSGVVDLSGFHFTSGFVYTFPSGVLLNSDEYLVVAVDSVAIKHTYGYASARQWTTGGLSNGGEPIALKNASGALIDTLRFDDAPPWPVEPDGDGTTLVLCDPTADNTMGANWVISTTSAGITVNGKTVYGSPGTSDDACGPSGCTDTYDTIAPVVCSSYTSPSANYTWTTSGSYLDTIPNAAGCDSIITINLTVDNSVSTLTAAVSIDSLPSCNTYMDGGATVSGSGGNTPFTYLWSNAATTASITGVGAGSYIATITDADGCMASDTAVITEPVALVPTMVVDSNVSCYGLANGGASVSVSGGSPPYTYLWSNSATTATIAGVTAGTYIVGITDANGCSVTDTAIITQPVLLTSTIVVDSNVSCYGLANGGASVSVSGGSPPYTYLWSNSATTATIAGVTAGTYIVGITDANGCTVNDTAIITEPLVLSSTMVVDSNVSCNGYADGGASVMATGGTTPYTYLWSNSATTASITGIIAGTYTVSITDANGCTVNDTAIITQPPSLASSMVVDAHVSCNGGSDGAATVSVSGGGTPYTYLWTNSATTASIAGVMAGTYAVSVMDANGCTINDTAIITEPVAITGIATLTVCDSLLWIDGNTYYSNNNTAVFTLPAANGCDSLVTLNLTVQASPTANAGIDVGICEDALHTLNGLATNHTSLMWTTSGDGLFDDATLAAATYTPGFNDIGNGSVTLTLTAYAVSPCVDHVTDELVLSIQQLPLANAGTDATICEDDTYTLSGVVADNQSALWTSSGDGSFDDATQLGAIYTPGSNDLAAGTVDLILTAHAIAPCATDYADTMTLSIQYLPVASAGSDAVVCETDSYTLSGGATNQQTVLWTTAGDGSFDDASKLDAIYTPGAADISAGSVELTLIAHALSPCAVDHQDMMTLNIQYVPSADAGADAPICETDTYTLQGIAANQQNTLWTTAGDGTFDDPTSAGAVYTPGTADIATGNVMLSFTAYAISPCAIEDIDDMLISIQHLPTADAGADDMLCETSAYTLSGMATNQQNILWTTAGDGTFDDASSLGAVYTPGVQDISNASVVLTLTAYATTPCAVDASDMIMLSIQYAPEALAGPDDLICETDSYTLSGSATNYESVLWTTSGDGTFDDASLLHAVYTPGVNDITFGSAVLSLTSYAIIPCVLEDIDDMVLSIQLLPQADAGTDASICEPDTYLLNGSATEYETVLWTTAGDGSFDDPTLLTAEYTPGTNDIANGSVNLELTAYAINPCVVESTDQMDLSIQWLPTSNAGNDGEICEGETHQLNGSAQNEDHTYWATLGDGSYDDPFALDAVYTPGPEDIEQGSAGLILFAYAIDPCPGAVGDTINLVINTIATAYAGEDDNMCELDTYQLSGEVSNNNGLLWTTSGDGSFDDPANPNATYTPGQDDIGAELVELTLTAFGNANCPGDVSDAVSLFIFKSPEQPLLPVGPTAVDLDEISTSVYKTNTVANADEYSWTLEPAEAGSIEGNDTVGIAYWNAAYTGLVAQIWVMADNDYCNPVSSEVLEIGVSPVGVGEQSLNASNISIFPNPTHGVFEVVFTGFEGDVELQMINETGRLVEQRDIRKITNNSREIIDITDQPAATYYLRFVHLNESILIKVVKK